MLDLYNVASLPTLSIELGELERRSKIRVCRNARPRCQLNPLSVLFLSILGFVTLGETRIFQAMAHIPSITPSSYRRYHPRLWSVRYVYSFVVLVLSIYMYSLFTLLLSLPIVPLQFRIVYIILVKLLPFLIYLCSFFVIRCSTEVGLVFWARISACVLRAFAKEAQPCFFWVSTPFNKPCLGLRNWFLGGPYEPCLRRIGAIALPVLLWLPHPG